MVKPNVKLALLPLAICLASSPVMSATNSELESRLQNQEKKIKKVERKLKGTRNAVKQNRSRLSDIAKNLKINGFFSSGFSQFDSEDFEFDLFGMSDEFSSSSVTKVGIQMTFKVSDDIEATAQMVSRGTNGYNLEAEWAYLNWSVSDNLTARIGRQRVPFYMLSEYIDVGYALPWTRPPLELYKLPLNNMDATSIIYDFDVGDTKLSVQAYFGEAIGRVDQLGTNFKVETNGLSATAETGAWRFFVGYSNNVAQLTDIDVGGPTDGLLAGINSPYDPVNPENSGLKASIDTLNSLFPQANISSMPTLKTDGIDSIYTAAGFTYDDGKLLIMGEIANLSLDSFILPSGDSGYLMVGYHFGKWMPHLTFARFYTDADSDAVIKSYIAGAVGLSEFRKDPGPLTAADGLQLIQEQNSITLGLVYDLNTKTKVKFDVTHYSDFAKNTTFTHDGEHVVASKINGYGIFDLSTDADPLDVDTSATLITFAVDAVF